MGMTEHWKNSCKLGVIPVLLDGWMCGFVFKVISEKIYTFISFPIFAVPPVLVSNGSCFQFRCGFGTNSLQAGVPDLDVAVLAPRVPD